QGGLVIYVIDGKGYSIVDGERKDWEKGDLVLLPMKPEGVVHQHFNLDPSKPAVWAALINMPIHEYLASDYQQVANSPDFKEEGDRHSGARLRREPGIHVRVLKDGFRAPRCARPRNDLVTKNSADRRPLQASSCPSASAPPPATPSDRPTDRSC